MRKLITLTLLLLLVVNLKANLQPDSIIKYKEVDDVELKIHFFFPPNHQLSDKTPAIVFFHGGGFKQGSPSHFYGQSKYLASRGMVALNVQYRTQKANGTTPVECIKDGKSAMRWVLKNAAKYGVDSGRIVAGGGSAGGHIAASMAVLSGFNEKGEDTTVSCKPKALVLFNPVLNMGPDGYGYNRVKEFYKKFSPHHNIKQDTPPTLIMLGTKDKLFTPKMAEAYKNKMEGFGQRCDLILYEGQEHAFFNKDRSEEMYRKTLADTDKFLVSLGYLKQKTASNKKSKKVKKGAKNRKPNLLIIHTDEHNLRTLGCYRKTMSEEQAYMWGKDAIVETPNIDRIADEGLLCKNWYASSPVCTPSRASMISGLYPIATGSHRNDFPLKDNVITFAHILKENGYATSYVGKWHLDGDAKPGIAPNRKFGFDDNRYMINRGHWKTLGQDEDGMKVLDKRNEKGGSIFDPNQANEKNFTTDFLVDRTLEIIERDKEKPFCLMLSIPDPHGPDKVRKPYSNQYTGMKFEQPRTAQANGRVLPKWNKQGGKNKSTRFLDKGIAQYYGMVKCIDDNVGRILDYLEANGLDDNTIVIFTSDHGDLMGEHGKINKGLPYEMSARVAFVLKYPEKVKAGKQIEKAYTMADFTPTILGVMDIDHSQYRFHGTDMQKDFTSKKKYIKDDRIVYLTNALGRWVAATNGRYKLVLSPTDKPWLFDLETDPDEMTNFYNHPEYKEIAENMKKELYRQMKLYKEPLLEKGTLIDE